MERFWVYLDNKVQGPVDVPALRKLSGFNLLTQVCAEQEQTWRVADEVIEIKAYFSAPPRGSSLAPEPQPELPAMEKPQMQQIPLTAVSAVAPAEIETIEDVPPVALGNTAPRPGSAPASTPGRVEGLRMLCITCGYKNPRDLTSCMKCGTPLTAVGTPAEEKPPISMTIPLQAPAPVAAAPAAIVKSAETKPDSQMMDIPIARIAIILSSIVLAGAVVFTAVHVWQVKHKKNGPHHPVVVNTPPVTPAPPASMSGSRKHGRRVRHSVAAALPGVEATASTPEPQAHPKTPETQAGTETAPTPPAPERTEAPKRHRVAASYTVLNDAYPPEHRQPAPIDSTYAVKRRGEHGLWSGRENDAIQQVQSHRVYGGRRTIGRNAEILMQILRDREYTTAFESGKRLYLFNDADWAISQKEGPVFEVRLTFSGGKEADGSPRQPLRFAFNADLERQTVEPGGEGKLKSNTMHAFFDESRIPPEERRGVAKDTEDLVQAAQPGASPLALDTIAKHYAATYSFPALSRVADTYGLTIVNKKLAHETASISEVLPDMPSGSKTDVAPAPEAPEKRIKLAPSATGAVQYSMERGTGRDRLIVAQVPSRATPGRLWETLTSYDRLTQFVPDMLVSQREGQDGGAVIVHMVSLTRLMVFVFKINLHLRILEHPQEHRLEFERIAGDFEKFGGYIEITSDPSTARSILELHLTLAPKGFTPEWALKGMAQHFLVPVLDAIRSKSETN